MNRDLSIVSDLFEKHMYDTLFTLAEDDDWRQFDVKFGVPAKVRTHARTHGYRPCTRTHTLRHDILPLHYASLFRPLSIPPFKSIKSTRTQVLAKLKQLVDLHLTAGGGAAMPPQPHPRPRAVNGTGVLPSANEADAVGEDGVADYCVVS